MQPINRRSFLALGAAATTSLALPKLPLPAPKLNRVKLSITWGMTRQTPIAEALAKTNELGFDAYEMFNWRDAATLATFVTERKKYPKLECACITANKGVEAPGCGLTNPKERDQFLKEMEAAVAAAKQVESKRLVTLTGNEVAGMSREAMMESCIAGLKAVAPMLEKNGITAVVEILNTYVNHPGYFLTKVADGARMVDAVGSPNVKLLFDIYHVQIMEGFLIKNIQNNIQRIGHFHIGDVPGRHQPGTGEINYRNVFKAINDLGYEGFAALEYGPTIPLYEDMANMRKMTMFE
ncbi:MAG: TIM barrel protein [Blastocatellia bacterium]